MLVGGGVENNFDPIGQKYLAHALRVTEVGDTEYLALIAAALCQLVLQMKDSGFILIDTQKKFGFIGPDLPAEFGSDGTGGSRYHDHPAPNMLAHRFEIEIDRDPSQEIGEGNFSNLVQDDTTRDQFRHFRESSESRARLLTYVHQAAHLGLGSRWNRDQDFIDSLQADHVCQSLDRTKHRYAQNPQTLLERIVVHTTDHLIAGFDSLGFANDHLGGMSRTDQE